MPSPELYARHFSRVFTGDVVDGFTLTPGTGLKAILAPGNTLIRYGSAALASARMVSLVAPFEIPVETPDASNPRIDAVVVYVDNSVELPGGVPSADNEDGKGVPAAKIVKGSPSANPTAPTATAIKAAIGSSNPYTVLAEVRVDAGVTVIAESKITDSRAIAMMPSSVYSASEQVVGTWIDGKRLYRKVIPVTARPLGSSTFGHGIKDLAKVVRLSSVTDSTSGVRLPIPLPVSGSSDGGWQIEMQIDQTNLLFKCVNGAVVASTVIVEYTKSV